MIGVIRTGYALATHWISDTIGEAAPGRSRRNGRGGLVSG